MNLLKTIALSLVVLIVQACASYEPVELIEVTQTNLESLTPEGAKMSVAAKIKNPNDYNIKLNAKDLKLYLNESLVGIAQLDNTVELKKNSTQEYSFTISSTVPPDGNIDLGVIALGGLTGALQVKLEGEVVAKAKGISKTIPLSLSESIKL